MTNSQISPSWYSKSYAPWDDLYPRRYEDIILDEVTSPIHMNVEVGLLESGERIEAGFDWVCQH